MHDETFDGAENEATDRHRRVPGHHGQGRDVEDAFKVLRAVEQVDAQGAVEKEQCEDDGRHRFDAEDVEG